MKNETQKTNGENNMWEKEEMIKFLKSHRAVTVHSLAYCFGGSPASHRAGLQSMEKDGTVRRVGLKWFLVGE